MKRTRSFTDDFKDEELDDDLEDGFEPDDPFSEQGPRLDDEDDDEGEDDELSGLEVEELNMVEEGVSAKVLTSEQAMEVAGIRRAELSINPDDHAIRQNEFQCETCFLVKRLNQRSAPGSDICVDCY